MSMLEKLNKLANQLESSPGKFEQFMTDYEQYRNKVVFNSIKDSSEVFITKSDFTFIDKSEFSDDSEKILSTSLGNKSSVSKSITNKKIVTNLTTYKEAIFTLAS
jgi:chromosome condensin MukBEF ATPase and DNA-binding subunit MukB